MNILGENKIFNIMISQSKKLLVFTIILDPLISRGNEKIQTNDRKIDKILETILEFPNKVFMRLVKMDIIQGIHGEIQLLMLFTG